MGWVVSAALLLDTVPSRDVLDVSDCLQLNDSSEMEGPVPRKRRGFLFRQCKMGSYSLVSR